MFCWYRAVPVVVLFPGLQTCQRVICSIRHTQVPACLMNKIQSGRPPFSMNYCVAVFWLDPFLFLFLGTIMNKQWARYMYLLFVISSIHISGPDSFVLHNLTTFVSSTTKLNQLFTFNYWTKSCLCSHKNVQGHFWSFNTLLPTTTCPKIVAYLVKLVSMHIYIHRARRFVKTKEINVVTVLRRHCRAILGEARR